MLWVILAGALFATHRCYRVVVAGRGIPRFLAFVLALVNIGVVYVSMVVMLLSRSFMAIVIIIISVLLSIVLAITVLLTARAKLLLADE
jgi:hypothetical protein